LKSQKFLLGKKITGKWKDKVEVVVGKNTKGKNS